jgi:hypothetical protein
MPLFLMSGNPLVGVGGCVDRKPIRDILGLDPKLDPTNQVLTNEQFAVCVRTINALIERLLITFFEDLQRKEYGLTLSIYS